jgi:hypothetical protein
MVASAKAPARSMRGVTMTLLPGFGTFTMAEYASHSTGPILRFVGYESMNPVVTLPCKKAG